MNGEIAPAVQIVAPGRDTARLWTILSILAGILCITAWMVFSSNVNS
jgi:hypothetical protein